MAQNMGPDSQGLCQDLGAAIKIVNDGWQVVSTLDDWDYGALGAGGTAALVDGPFPVGDAIVAVGAVGFMVGRRVLKVGGIAWDVAKK